MARGDFPFNRLELNLRPNVARPRVRAEVGVPLNIAGQEARHADQRDNRRFIPRLRRNTAAGGCRCARDSAGVALGVQHAFCAKVRAVRPCGVSIASRCVEIPLVDGNGQISGVLCQSMPPSDVRGALVSGRGEAREIEDAAQLVVHDINNLLAVIGSGRRLLEGQSDSADRKVIVRKMQQAISRRALLRRQFLEAARPCPDFMGGFVAGSSLAALAGTLAQALRPRKPVQS